MNGALTSIPTVVMCLLGFLLRKYSLEYLSYVAFLLTHVSVEEILAPFGAFTLHVNGGQLLRLWLINLLLTIWAIGRLIAPWSRNAASSTRLIPHSRDAVSAVVAIPAAVPKPKACHRSSKTLASFATGKGAAVKLSPSYVICSSPRRI